MGVGEDDLPTLESCRAVQVQQKKFQDAIGWKGGSKDVVKIIPSPRREQAIALVIHNVLRFKTCTVDELSDEWMGTQPVTRISTIVHQEGDRYGLQSRAKWRDMGLAGTKTMVWINGVHFGCWRWLFISW